MLHFKKAKLPKQAAQHEPSKISKKPPFYAKLLVGGLIAGTVVACSPATSGSIDQEFYTREKAEETKKWVKSLPQYLLARQDGKYFVVRTDENWKQDKLPTKVTDVGAGFASFTDVRGRTFLVSDLQGTYWCAIWKIGPEGADITISTPGSESSNDIWIRQPNGTPPHESGTRKLKDDLALLGTDRFMGDETAVYSSPNHTDHYYAFMREDWKGVLWLHVKRTDAESLKESEVVSVEKRAFLLPEGEAFCKPPEYAADSFGNLLVATTSGLLLVFEGHAEFIDLKKEFGIPAVRDIKIERVGNGAWKSGKTGPDATFAIEVTASNTNQTIEFQAEVPDSWDVRLTGKRSIKVR